MGRAATGVAAILGIAALGLASTDQGDLVAVALPVLASVAVVAVAGRASGAALLAAVAPALAAHAGLTGGWEAGASAAVLAAVLVGAGGIGSRLRARYGDAGSRAFLVAGGALLAAPGLLGATREAVGQPSPAWSLWPPFLRGPSALSGTTRPRLPVAGGTGSAEIETTFALGGTYRPGRALPLRLVVRAAANGCRGVVRCAPSGGLPHDVRVDLPGGGIADVLVPVVPETAQALIWVSASFASPERQLGRGILVRPEPGQRTIVWVVGTGEAAPLPADLAERLGGPVDVVDQADLPAESWAYESVDLLVCGRLDGSRLTGETARAIGARVAAGGAIVLADPDLLRRSPALDQALFDVQPPGEDPPSPAGGLPAAHWDAMRRRGLGIGGVTLATGDAPGRAVFRSGRGGGVLLLPLVEGAPVEAHALSASAWATVLRALPPSEATASPVAGSAVARLFPAATPGGWAFGVLLATLAAYPLALGWPCGRRLRLAAVLLAALGAAALGGSASGPAGEVVALVRPGPARTRGDGPPGETEWILHLAAARDARCAVALPPRAVARTLAIVPGEDAGAARIDVGDPSRLRDWDLARGCRRLLSVRGDAAVWPDIVAVPAGDALLLSNRTARPVAAVCYAASGGLADLGPLAPHETRRCVLPRPLPGAVATRRALMTRAGPEVARAIAIATERLAGTTPTCLCVVAPDATWPGPPLEVAGARVRALPPVLAVVVSER